MTKLKLEAFFEKHCWPAAFASRNGVCRGPRLLEESEQNSREYRYKLLQQEYVRALSRVEALQRDLDELKVILEPALRKFIYLNGRKDRA